MLSTAQSACKFLKQSPFTDCHAKVDVMPYYKHCMYDMCATGSNASVCVMVEDYVKACAEQGVYINWVKKGHGMPKYFIQRLG
ncbi:von Willebrand factor-like [Ciona intestinalis]